MKSFDVRLIEKKNRRFVEALGRIDHLECEKDVVDLLSVCSQFKAERILLHGNIFTEKFFDLKSGQAGMVVQKLVNYQIKTAALLTPDQVRGKFGEFVVETNHGHHFRVFFDRQSAETWLVAD
ncbi:MAG TPA: DUF4180 domain-containing protein [Bacteroidota bacterium]|nr:DUF4180 domain-containing protein [Bacteroidota bacterium]